MLSTAMQVFLQLVCMKRLIFVHSLFVKGLALQKKHLILYSYCTS